MSFIPLIDLYLGSVCDSKYNELIRTLFCRFSVLQLDKVISLAHETVIIAVLASYNILDLKKNRFLKCSNNRCIYRVN